MRNLRLGISLIALSVFAVLLLRFAPGSWLSDVRFANPTVSYVVLGLIFYGSVHFFGSPSLEYFRLPRLHFKTGVALLVASILMILEISRSDNVHLGLWDAVRGMGFLLAIGFGEEMFSRAFTFGVLHRFGILKAVFISSILFGLMHLNLYVGADWDGWYAYSHVVSTFGFGVFACVLMIVTRSIWMAVIFHAVCDWGLVFDKVAQVSGNEEKWRPGFWDGFTHPFPELAFMVGLAMVLLWIDRGRVPAWMHRLALKWKLVKSGYELTV